MTKTNPFKLPPAAPAWLSAVLWWTPELAVIFVSLILADLFTAWLLLPGFFAALRIAVNEGFNFLTRYTAASCTSVRSEKSAVIEAEIVEADQEVTYR